MIERLLYQSWSGNLITLFAGMILPLAFAPFHYYPLAWLSLIILFISWQGISAKQAAWRGFFFGFGMFGVGVSWVYVAIHDFGAASMPLAAILTAVFIAFLASFLALATWLAKKIIGTELKSKDYLLIVPLAWLFFEWFKTVFFTGFPWLEIGVSQIDGPMAGFTPILGVLGVSFLTALCASIFAMVWHNKQWSWLLLVSVIVLSGHGLKGKAWTQPVDRPIKVSLIQGNVAQATKWNPEQLMKTLAMYRSLTEQNWDSDLIVWPENATPVFYHQAKQAFFDPLADEAKQHQTELLIGLPVKDSETGAYYNSLMSLAAPQQQFYYKSRLVPFGEFVPFEWLRGIIAFFDMPMSSFTAGDREQKMFDLVGQKLGASICYEDVFSTQILQSLPEATLLINASNNGWYGDSFAPHQHLQIAQNRALETGRPIIRATTSGISALIESNGAIASQSTQFQQQVLTGLVQPISGSTPYVSWQQKPLLIMVVLMWLLWLILRFRFNK